MTREDAMRIADEANARLPLCAFIAVNEASAELSRAMGIHGAMRGMHEGYAVILEELDELWDEIKQCNPDKKRIRAEAIQVAAMALRFVADVCGEPPPIVSATTPAVLVNPGDFLWSTVLIDGSLYVQLCIAIQGEKP